MNKWTTLTDNQIETFKQASIRYSLLTGTNKIDFFIDIIDSFFNISFDPLELLITNDNEFISFASTLLTTRKPLSEG
jgi:hypothetical protein